MLHQTQSAMKFPKETHPIYSHSLTLSIHKEQFYIILNNLQIYTEHNLQ
jgi:hypothetical protein